MKKINILSLIFTAFVLGSAFLSVNAQNTTPTPETQNPNQAVRPFKILQELGLTREQIQQIRLINQERKPLMQDAQRNWREANRNLDLAIYADSVNDEEVQMRTKEAQIAQSELLKARSQTEFLIRKILTPEQLIKFRQLRELLQQRVKEFKNQNNPNNQPQRPLTRFQQRRNQNRQQ